MADMLFTIASEAPADPLEGHEVFVGDTVASTEAVAYQLTRGDPAVHCPGTDLMPFFHLLGRVVGPIRRGDCGW